MSRVANNPIDIPQGVDIQITQTEIKARGKLGELVFGLNHLVKVKQEGNQLLCAVSNNSISAKRLAGTFRALINNIVLGVSEGFEAKLQLVGVGYRAKVQGKVLNLTLGFSHPVDLQTPEGLTVETPTPTEIIIKGIDKQKVFQFAANIRALRPPEPYKGKGIRYVNEEIVRKEAKKK